MAATERDYYELLGVERERRRGRDQEGLPPARARAASRRLARRRTPSSASARWSRRTRCSRTPSGAQLYDRFGHAGLRSGGFQPSDVRPRQPHRPLLRVLRRRPLRRRRPRRARARRRHRARASRSSWPRRRRGTQRDVPFDVARPVRALRRQRRRARNARLPTARRAAARAGMRQVSRSVFGEFVRTQTCPTCSGAGQRVEQPCEACQGAGRVVEERTLEVEIPAGIHDGQRIRLTRRGARGRRRRARRRRLRRGARPARRALRPGGQRRLHDGRPDDDAGRARRDSPGADARRRGRARRSTPGRSRARSRPARAGAAGAAGLRPRRPARARERRRPAPADRRAAAAAGGVRSHLRPTRRTEPTRGSSRS